MSEPNGYEELVELCSRYERRIRELETAIAQAVKFADDNGMAEWPVFKRLRKVGGE